MRPPFIADRQRPDSGRLKELTKEEVRLRREGSDPDEDTAGRITTAADIYTQEMGLAVAREYCRLTGLRPHLIMCNLHRSKLDANRPLVTAAEDPLAQQVYAEYHAFLELAKTEVGRGLLLDLHGQNHQQNSIELGYLYKRAELNGGHLPETGTSVASMLRRNGLTANQLVAGEGKWSLFTFLQYSN